MKKDNRLRDNRDFLIVYRQGRKCWNKHFNAYVLRTNRQGIRVGFSVNKKYGNAVERNRIKRRLKAITRGHLEDLQHPCDLIIIPKKNTQNLDHKSLDESVKHLFYWMNERM